MKITEHLNLKSLNTFGIDAIAEKFIEVNTIDDLFHLNIKSSDQPLILGGGSNLLFTKPSFPLVIKNNLKGITIVEETEKEVKIKVGAGEIWHEFVQYVVAKGFGGIENLSLIPGSVGASPIQNIGAYGVEIKDIFEELEAFHIGKQEIHNFNKEQCEFGYRESVFKHELKGQYIIISVTYRLKKDSEVNVSYGAISSELEKEGITKPNIQDVSNAVIRIRQSKLPDTNIIGCAGSFFKNPIVPKETYDNIKTDHPQVPSYIVDANNYKIPAGWLIEKCGWKGKTFGNYGVYDKQALVLVNYGGATGKEIYQLSTDIINNVKREFGIELEREVNIL